MSEKIETGGPAYPHTLRGHPIETGMSEKFTSEPWVVGNADGLLFGKKQGNGTEPIGFVFGPSLPERSEVGMRAIANARRIVACVNACDGISTENLEDNRPVKWVIQQYNNVVKQRDELLKALMLAESVYRQNCVNEGEPSSVLDAMQAAILKATGEQA